MDITLNISKEDHDAILRLIGYQWYQIRVELERCNDENFKVQLEDRLKYWHELGTRLAKR
jgi:hypothetical protein